MTQQFFASNFRRGARPVSRLAWLLFHAAFAVLLLKFAFVSHDTVQIVSMNSAPGLGMEKPRRSTAENAAEVPLDYRKPTVTHR